MIKGRHIFGPCLIPIFLLILCMQPAFAREVTPAMKTAITWIEENKANYDEIAKYIWDNPELSLVEFKSSAKLQEYLASQGFKIGKGVSGMPTAFVATWGSGKPVIGILGEFDALPDLSQEPGATTEKPLIPGAPGHGCGHNLFGTSSATAAIAVAKAMEKHGIKGTVKLFGTPAEETLVGKVFMNRDGVFDGTDVMISWHPAWTNWVAYATNDAMDSIKFRFYGKTAHAGATPQAGRSALDAVELMDVGMNYMREHIIQDARISYVITKGGEVPNYVPKFAEVWYFIRSPRRAQVDHLRSWMLDVAKGAALMTQTKMEYQILTGTYEMLPNRTLSQMGDEIAKLIGPPTFTPEDQEFGEAIRKTLDQEATGIRAKVQGGAMLTRIFTSDFKATFPNVSNFKGSSDINHSWKIPYLEFRVANLARGTILHTWQVVSQTRMPPALKAGVQVSKWMAAAALECLSDPKLIEDAWTELNKYVAEFGYKEPLPADAKLPTFEDLYGIKPEAVPGAKK